MHREYWGSIEQKGPGSVKTDLGKRKTFELGLEGISIRNCQGEKGGCMQISSRRKSMCEGTKFKERNIHQNSLVTIPKSWCLIGTKFCFSHSSVGWGACWQSSRHLGFDWSLWQKEIKPGLQSRWLIALSWK